MFNNIKVLANKTIKDKKKEIYYDLRLTMIKHI